MKKDLEKKIQKLSLNRETLRHLEEGDLSVAFGGATIICSERCTRPSCYC